MFSWAHFPPKRGHYGPHPSWKTSFFGRNNKNITSAFRNYFIKISYALTELGIFFYLEWCFLSKKCHFHKEEFHPAKSGYLSDIIAVIYTSYVSKANLWSFEYELILIQYIIQKNYFVFCLLLKYRKYFWSISQTLNNSRQWSGNNLEEISIW